MCKPKRLVPIGQAAASTQSPCEWGLEHLQISMPLAGLTAGTELWQECESQKLLSVPPAIFAPQYPGLS